MTQPGLSVLKVAAPIDVTVRDSHPGDLAEIHRIYAASVMQGTGSFEETPPTAEEMAVRRQTILDRGLPYLVAEFRGGVVGYAYAGPFRPRSAYRYTLEDSVYVAPEVRGLAVGRTLLAALIDRCTALGYRRMIAVIGDSENHASIRAHAANGFTHAGTLVHVGLKFGRWLDSVYMQRQLADETGQDPQD
ncbi:MAG: N-acetyltransferase family protein [Rhodospirillaceae bacterium]